MQRAITWGCFFLSGAAGLIYEVCWIRRASLVFGSTTFAVSTVLAVFFLGLAMGSELFGRLSQRLSRPLRAYALLEVGLAAAALASLPAFDLADNLYGKAYLSFTGASGLLWGARVALVSLVLLPPTFLMGGTLPLFCRQYVVRKASIASPVGLLYALNTLGAAVGCAAAGFILIPRLGMQRAILVGAVLNLVAAAVVGSMRMSRDADAAAPARPPAPEARRRETIVIALAFLSGFAVLGYEVLWTRYLSLLVRNTVTTYTVTLTVVLVGIVTGSALTARLYDRTRRRAAVFGALQILTGLSVLALMTLPVAVWNRIGDELGIMALLLLPPAILAGASFPLVVRMAVDDPTRAGLGVGRITAFNTLGGILGSLVIGFVALPGFGIQRSLVFATGVSLATGVAAWLSLEGSGSRRVVLLAAGASLLLWLAIPRITGTRVPADFLANRGTLVDYREGLQSNLAVIRNKSSLVLEIDRWWQGQDRKSHQIMAAHLPMMIHPDPHRVLVIGVGVGQTPARMTMYDIERLDCVDIEPVIFDLIRRHFATRWLDDPRTRIIREDGRNFLAHTDARYDVISLELGQIFRPGVASFYTADFYRRARERLEPGGILSQFVPLPFLSVPSFRSVVRTFLETFPQSSLWYNTSELLLIGRNGAPFELDSRRLNRISHDPAIREDLQYSHWGGPTYWLERPEVFLGGFLCGPRGLAALSAGAPILRDDRPALEYATARVHEALATELPALELLRKHLEPVAGVTRGNLPPEMVAEAGAIREKNLADIVASVSLRRVDVETRGLGAVLAHVADALRANPENARANRLTADGLAIRNQLDEARVYYERALAMQPDDQAGQLGLAVVLHRQGRYADALAHYGAALDLDPTDPEAHNGMGAVLAEAGDLESAARHLERALQLRPDYSEARRNLAQVRAASGTH